MSIISFEAEKIYKIAYDEFYFNENTDLAYSLAKKVLKIQKNHIKTLKLLGNILIFKDEINSATDVFKKAYLLDTKDFEINSKLAFCYEKQNMWAASLDFCEKSAMCTTLGDFEKMATLYALKIDIFLELNKFNRALELFKNALKNLSFEEGQNLKTRFDFLNLRLSPSVAEFKKAKKA